MFYTMKITLTSMSKKKKRKVTFSFCKPSLGPTSTIFMYSGSPDA